MRELEELVAADTAALRAWIRFTPRGRRSAWSQRNVENVARLASAGRMQPSGRAAVEAAAIAAVPAAQAMFDVLIRTNRYALIHRLGAVKKQETRVRKIEQFVELLARHEAPYPQRAKPA